MTATYHDAAVVRGPRDWVDLPRIPNDWQVLDIGPGRYPLQRADQYLDHDESILAAIDVPESARIIGDLDGGLPEIRDKAFDYVWVSHVLEHVKDPAACARTISRIGKSGTIVLPTAIKEAIFNFEEYDHHWLILPHPETNAPIFVRHSPMIARIRDIDIQKINCRLYRTGTNRDDPEDKFMREWFLRIEPTLDLVHHWTDELKLTVIG